MTRRTRAGIRTAARGTRPPAPDVPVYVISVAAELTGLHPQTLRTYDRLGLVSPGPHRWVADAATPGATSSCCVRSRS